MPRWGEQYLLHFRRVGLAYHLSEKPNWGSVFRAGFGTFYDLGYASQESPATSLTVALNAGEQPGLRRSQWRLPSSLSNRRTAFDPTRPRASVLNHPKVVCGHSFKSGIQCRRKSLDLGQCNDYFRCSLEEGQVSRYCCCGFPWLRFSS